MSEEDHFGIDDIESFIKGLRETIDSLSESDPESYHGMQLQLARAISLLRNKKLVKIVQIPKVNSETPDSKEGLKNFLLMIQDNIIAMQNYCSCLGIELSLRQKLRNMLS